MATVLVVESNVLSFQGGLDVHVAGGGTQALREREQELLIHTVSGKIDNGGDFESCSEDEDKDTGENTWDTIDTWMKNKNVNVLGFEDLKFMVRVPPPRMGRPTHPRVNCAQHVSA